MLNNNNRSTGEINCINLPVAYGRINAEGELITANTRWLNLFETDVPVLPSCQPNGQLTKDFIRGYIEEASRLGESSFEIYADKPTGSFVCAAVTLQSEADGTFTICANDVTRYKTMLGDAIKKEQETHEINNILIDSAPFVLHVWDENHDLLAVSDQVTKIFEIDSKQEYVDKFMEFSPEFQPCGMSSAEKARLMLEETFKIGRSNFEWMHKTSKGDPLPMDVVTVRFTRSGKHMVAGYSIDQRSKNAARESEKRALDLAKRFLDAAPIFIEMWDNKLNLTGTNQEAVKMFGLRDTDHYLEVYDKLHPEFQPCGMRSDIKAALVIDEVKKNGYTEGEWLHIDLDGNPVPVQSYYVRFDIGNDEHYIVGYSQDLRPVRKAIDDVNRALEISEMYLNSAPFFVEIWGSDLTLKGCNEAAAKMFGLSGKQDYLKIFSELIPDFQPCGKASEEVLNDLVGKALREGYSRSEFTHVGTDGQIIPVDVVYVRLNNGEEDIVVGYNQDLRPLRNVTDKLKFAEERNRILLDASPTPSIIFDESFNAVDSNFATLSLFAKEPGKVLIETYPFHPELEKCVHEQCVQFHVCGRDYCPLRTFLLNNHLDIFTNPDEDCDAAYVEIKRLCREVAKYGTRKFEKTLKTLYGQTTPCEITIVSVNYNGSQGFAFYLRDLKEEKLRVMAEEASRAKSSFLSTISHELRTPLNAIMGITEIYLMDSGTDPKIRMDFEKIYTSSDVLLCIINDILDLSKIEAGKLAIMERKYEIASFISDSIQLNIMRLGSKPIEFVLNVDEQTPAFAFGDELRVKQILLNLLSNAFKYTEEGQVTLDIRTYDMPDCDSKFNLQMRVSDTGVGMTKQQIDRLFEEFSRFNETESYQEGTGLGMSITQSLVTHMGGKLTVESESGKGSIFTVILPQGKIADSECLGKEVVENLRLFRTVGSRMDHGQIIREPMPYGRVLVVDDVEVNIYVVMGLLMPYELQVDDASNGLEAIEKIRIGNEYDVIFMDHMMPEMDGIEATKIIRDMGYTKPIVALTANAVTGQAEMFLNNGFDDFISKPIDVRSMNLILNKLIRDRHTSNAHKLADEAKE